MINIYEAVSKLPSYYEYDGYNIIYNKLNGFWEIPNFKGKSFADYEQAEEFIDNLPNENELISDGEVEFVSKKHKKPTKQKDGFPKTTTYKMIQTKYNNVHCMVYLLNLCDSNKYASKDGICDFCDDDMQIYKTREVARYSARNRKGDYDIEIAEIYDGDIYTL